MTRRDDEKRLEGGRGGSEKLGQRKNKRCSLCGHSGGAVERGVPKEISLSGEG